MSPAQAISPTPSIASRARSSVALGSRTTFAASPAMRLGARIAALIPSATSSACDGSCSGAHCPFSIGGGVGARSNRTVAMSTPEIPSTSAWWVFDTSAKPPSARPWTSHISHSGFERSRRWEKIRPAIPRSCSIEPGAGSAVWRTW